MNITPPLRKGTVLYRAGDTATGCYFIRSGVFKTVTTTDPGPCDIATFLADNNPDYDGFLVIRRTYVSFTYASPADGRQHAGRYELPRGDTGARYRIGGQFNIRAHKEKPEETRRI